MADSKGSAVVWFEVAGTDLASMSRFYEALFGWRVEADDSGYGMVDTGADAGIPGGVVAPGPEAGTWVTFYVDVADLDATLAAADDLGATVAQPPTPLPTGGRIAQILDPQGQRVGLIQSP